MNEPSPGESKVMLFATKTARQEDEPPPNTADERERRLLLRTAAGDRAAFETLYRAYFPRLLRFLRRMLLRPHSIEEVLNDAMLVVWRKAESFNGASKVSTWIFAIAYRRALKCRDQFDDPLEFEGEPIDEVNPRPEDVLLHQELGEALEHALQTISANQRAVVELTYFHGCRYQEIAQIMDCPVETVKTRMFHARRRLRDALRAQRPDLP
jgi:RNA polymerase sigma-70 factor (ECF subfamily)